MHRHLGQVNGHFLDQVLLQIVLLLSWCTLVIDGLWRLLGLALAFIVILLALVLLRLSVVCEEGHVLLPLGLGARDDLDVEHLGEINLQEVEHSGSVDLVLD